MIEHRVLSKTLRYLNDPDSVTHYFQVKQKVTQITYFVFVFSLLPAFISHQAAFSPFEEQLAPKLPRHGEVLQRYIIHGKSTVQLIHREHFREVVFLSITKKIKMVRFFF